MRKYLYVAFYFCLRIMQLVTYLTQIICHEKLFIRILMINLKRTNRLIFTIIATYVELLKNYELSNILFVPMPSRRSLSTIRVIHFISNPVICRKSTLNVSIFSCIVAFFFDISSRNVFIRAIVKPVLVLDNLLSNIQ